MIQMGTILTLYDTLVNEFIVVFTGQTIFITNCIFTHIVIFYDKIKSSRVNPL